MKKLALLALPAALLVAACAGQAIPSPAAGAGLQRAAAGGGAAPPNVASGAASAADGTLAPAAPAPAAPPAGVKAELAASLSLRVKHGRFRETIDGMLVLAQQLGGYPSSGSLDAAPADGADPSVPGPAHGTFSFKIPSARFDGAIVQFSNFGDLTASTLGGPDRTGQYIDIQAHIDSLKVQRAALERLLQQAPDLQTIQNLTQQIANVDQQVDQLEGQQNAIQHQVDYGTLTVHLAEAPAVPAAAVTDGWGFRAALLQAAHNAVAVLNVVIVGLGSVAPVLLVLGIPLVAFRRRWLALVRRQA